MVRPVKLVRNPKHEHHHEQHYRVVLFSHEGMYPRGLVCMPKALFHADDDIVFAVTHGRSWYKSNDTLPYSEVDWMEPELVRLLGAFIMAERPWNNLQTRFYPVSNRTFVLNETAVDLMDPRTAQAVKKALLNTIDNRLWPKHVQAFWSLHHRREFVLFDQSELCMQAVPLLWEAIRTENHLVMRGIQALVKSDMLGHHHEFQEEGTIATFIALDASFQMVLRHLRSSGNANPSSKDAGRWVYETFDKPLDAHFGADIKYFEEFYDQRVQTVHPGSRFGDLPYAPVMVDDRIHLRQELPSVFAYLVLGGFPPHYVQRIQNHEAEQARR